MRLLTTTPSTVIQSTCSMFIHGGGNWILYRRALRVWNTISRDFAAFKRRLFLSAHAWICLSSSVHVSLLSDGTIKYKSQYKLRPRKHSVYPANGRIPRPIRPIPVGKLIETTCVVVAISTVKPLAIADHSGARTLTTEGPIFHF